MYLPSNGQASLAAFAILLTDVLSSLPGEAKDGPRRNTLYGRIQGYIHKLSNGGEIERYLGVPFAMPPVGELRFENPVPPVPWKDTLLTTKLPPACMQEKMDKAYILDHKPDYDGSMNEDCLYLNIYVPVSRSPQKRSSKLEVLVYIHGGSNVVGMGAMFHGDVISDIGQIIVVTLNYRLGAFGFLYVPDLGIHGNYGLYDQTLAMTWIKENIVYFGGDPDKITLQGHSAGSVDVGLHVLSPKSKGLFRSVILQSGSPLAYWALIPKSKEGDITRGPLHHLYNLGCYFGDDKNSTLTCLRKLSATKITNKDYRHEKGYYSFVPVVDGNFVPEPPSIMLHEMQKGEKYSINCKNIVIGVTNDEGSLTAEVMIKNALESAGRPVAHDKHDTVPPDDLNVWDEAPPLPMYPYNSIHAFHELTVYLYTPWQDKDNATANVMGISNMVGDSTFLAPAVRAASLMSAVKGTVVFFYNFKHLSSTSLFPAWMGVPHGEDQFYLFGAPVIGHSKRNYTNMDKAVSTAVIKMWAQFVKQSKLFSKDQLTVLPRFTQQNESYNDISSNEDGILFSVKKNFRKQYTHFWNHLIPDLVTDLPVQVNSQTVYIQWILVALLCLTVIICVILAILLKKAMKKDIKRRPSSEEAGNMLP